MAGWRCLGIWCGRADRCPPHGTTSMPTWCAEAAAQVGCRTHARQTGDPAVDFQARRTATPNLFDFILHGANCGESALHDTPHAVRVSANPPGPEQRAQQGVERRGCHVRRPRSARSQGGIAVESAGSARDQRIGRRIANQFDNEVDVELRPVQMAAALRQEADDRDGDQGWPNCPRSSRCSAPGSWRSPACSVS